MMPGSLEDRMRVVAPRVPTPTAPETGRATGPLPDDVVAEQVQRLVLVGAVGSGMWAVGLAMVLFVLPRTHGVVAQLSAIVIDTLGIVACAAVCLYARYSRHAPAVKADCALWLMLLNAALVTLLNTWVQDPPKAMGFQVSWVVVVILLSGMVMPGTPRKMLIAGLAAASMDPLGVWLAHLRGVDVPSVATTLAMYLPNYTCAIAATLPSRMFQRMGRQLREARALGSYQLVEMLGHGGMGEVWRARHRWLAREAAVKLVRPAALGSGTEADSRFLRRRFEREAQATAALSSPHSIRLFDFGSTDEGQFYYAMELLVGRDLETFVKEFGPVPADRALYLLRQICHSLSEAHERGLVHRDIKPANIYLCRMGLDFDFVKVLDFGLVTFRDRDQAAGVTQTFNTTGHVTMGTPAYMAPEVILGRSDVDRRADVYAIGCVAYFLLTGQRVFDGDSAMQVLANHIHTVPVPPSQRTDLPIPPEMDEMVLRCLAKDPDERPQDARALLRLAHGCTMCEGWSNSSAQAWWERHLPELSEPLSFNEGHQEAAASVA